LHSGVTKEELVSAANDAAAAGSKGNLFWGSAKTGQGVQEAFDFLVNEASLFAANNLKKNNLKKGKGTGTVSLLAPDAAVTGGSADSKRRPCQCR
jgi:hypothetical protein